MTPNSKMIGVRKPPAASDGDVPFLPLKVLRLTGLWAPQRGKVARVYPFYSAFVMDFIFLGIITFVVTIVQEGASGWLIYTSALTSYLIWTTGKAIDLLRQRRGMLRLLQKFQELPQAPSGSPQAETITRATRQGNIISIVQLSTSAFTYCVGVTLPLTYTNAATSNLCRQRLLDEGVNVTAGECEVRVLPVDAWYPFDISHGWKYASAYIFQVWFYSYVIIFQTMLISLYVCLMLHAASHGRTLAERFRTASDERELKACVRHHQSFIECVQCLQGLLGPAALMQNFFSLHTICYALYKLSKETSFLMILHFGMFFMVMCVDAFLLCWYGEELASSSEQIVFAVYDSPWPDVSLRMRRAVITVLMRSQRSLRIRTAGGFKTLSRATFLELMQTSYTLYTVLVTVDD